MSVLENERLAENLFDRLEALEPVLIEQQYAEMQKDLMDLLVRSEYEDAQQAVIAWEQLYSGLLADSRADDRQEALSGDIF